MRYRFFLTALIVGLCLPAAGVLSADDIRTPVSSPVGSPTIPASSRAGGLIRNRTSDYYNVDGNKIVTGNVGGGRHFRGFVPYGSVSETGAYLNDSGSSSLDSFLRRSAGTSYIDRRIAPDQMYYSPSRAVTSVGIYRNTSIGSGQTRFQASSNDVSVPVLPRITAEESLIERRPLSVRMGRLDKLVNRELDVRSKILTTEELAAKDAAKTKPNEPDRLLDEMMQPMKPVEPVKPLSPDEVSKLRLEKLREEKEKKEVQPAEQQTTQPMLQQEKPQQSEQINRSQSDWNQLYSPRTQTPSELPEPSKAEIEKIRGEYKDFKSLAQAKVKGYLEQSAGLLKQGQYYRAADACVLAEVWDKSNPAVYTTRAVALFAAGEYMSSSYFLDRMLMLSPEYAKTRTDIAALIGDRDVFENMVVELQKWLQQSGSGELAFLMAYIQHQDGRKTSAMEWIKVAESKMPDRESVRALGAVIESSQDRQKQGGL